MKQWTFEVWDFISYLLSNVLSHFGHWNDFICSWTDNICSLKYCNLETDLLEIKHLKSIVPSWTNEIISMSKMRQDIWKQKWYEISYYKSSLFYVCAICEVVLHLKYGYM